MLDLALVMPVYNEDGCILDVAGSWRKMLESLNIKFRIIILNDGSKDRTRQVLASFVNDPCVEVINKENSGHGPTILKGYHEAVKQAEWIFQCDSDNEMKADRFPVLWENRKGFDALFGIRQDRDQNPSRRLISNCARILVRTLFGRAITDVNIPYRLIRANILKPIIDQIPDDTIAPNLLISGALSKGGMRIYEHLIPHTYRQTGKVSIVRWKLWRLSLKSFWQVIHFRLIIRTINSKLAEAAR